MLSRLFPCTLQLLLNDALLIGHLQQLCRIRFIQLATRLLRLSLFRIQELLGLSQFTHFRLKVLQLITEHRILLTQPLIVGVVHLSIFVGDQVLWRHWRSRL